MYCLSEIANTGEIRQFKGTDRSDFDVVFCVGGDTLTHSRVLVYHENV